MMESLPIRDSDVQDEVDLDNLFSSDDEEEEEDSSEPMDIDPEETTYVFRITPDDRAIDLTLESLEGFCQHKFTNWVIGTETTPKLHYHLVFTHEFELDKVKSLIQAQVYTYWPAPRPRGFGSKQYNLQVSVTPDAAISYAVKFGNYVFDGYTDDYIAQRKAESFIKPKISDFQSELIKLNSQFQDDPDMAVEDYATHFIQLKAKFNQRVNVSDAFQYAYSASIRRGGYAAAREILNNYLHRFPNA